MIKFTDIIKANGRYLYAVILIALSIFGIIFGVNYKESYYIADVTYGINVSGSSNERATEAVYKEMNIFVYSDSFVEDVASEVAKTNKNLANKITKEEFSNNLSIAYTQGNATFNLKYCNENEKDAYAILDVVIKLAIEKYNSIHVGTDKEFMKYYEIQTELSPDENVTMGIVSIVVGLIISEILLMCFISFNPYVENEGILERSTRSDILASIKNDKDGKVDELANNIEIMLKNKETNMLAFSNDSSKFGVDNLINNLASIYVKNKKVLILSYNKVESQIKGVDYKVINDKVNNFDEIKDEATKYDIVLLQCPNILTAKTYLHTLKLTDSIVLVAKKWKTKISNIIKIKQKLEVKDADILGIVYLVK